MPGSPPSLVDGGPGDGVAGTGLAIDLGQGERLRIAVLYGTAGLPSDWRLLCTSGALLAERQGAHPTRDPGLPRQALARRPAEAPRSSPGKRADSAGHAAGSHSSGPTMRPPGGEGKRSIGPCSRRHWAPRPSWWPGGPTSSWSHDGISDQRAGRGDEQHPQVRRVLDAQRSRLDISAAPTAVNEVSKLKERLKGEIVVPVAAS